ncbi:hypothetical protein GTQ34_15525 [Muricauda sp. JGD-17]|uniref:Signal transduction histidine kinase internal region domain-containing protein n=1 Tax=Flagellimonas ochracea TaxID=2696472 RepID=A0A964TEE6_9FLAO|nr:histidine kinase [Allomuricauda ochracea]NAY93320.1 hypothetical protein [Allomuricauda ochracea]
MRNLKASKNKNRPKTLIFYVLLAWVLFVCIDIFKKSLFVRPSGFIIFYYVPSILLWIGFTFFFIKAFRWAEKASLVRKIITLVVISLSLGVIKNLVTWLVSYLLQWFYNPDGTTIKKDFLGRLSTFHFMESIIISLVIMAVLYIVDLQKKYRLKSMEALELESQLVESQLRALKMQLQPHFLFNTYNTISMLVRGNKNDMAIDVISNMGDLLRNSLNGFSKNMTTVGEELTFIQKYLEIERIRHEGNLAVNMNIDQKAMMAPIPTLLLQPIIENAFKHGFDKYIGPTQLKVSIQSKSNRVHIEVFNTGPRLEKRFNLQKTNGIGLKNTLDRLNKLYGDDFTFDMTSVNHGVKVTISFPNKTRIYHDKNGDSR